MPWEPRHAIVTGENKKRNSPPAGEAHDSVELLRDTDLARLPDR